MKWPDGSKCCGEKPRGFLCAARWDWRARGAAQGRAELPPAVCGGRQAEVVEVEGVR